MGNGTEGFFYRGTAGNRIGFDWETLPVRAHVVRSEGCVEEGDGVQELSLEAHTEVMAAIGGRAVRTTPVLSAPVVIPVLSAAGRPQRSAAARRRPNRV